MDSRDRIIFTPIKSKKSENSRSFDQPHQELEFHVDESGRKYYEADDLESEDDSDDQRIDDGGINAQQTNDDSPLKYPEKFRPSQAFLDKINSQKPKPVMYDESRDLYYVVCDDDDLIPVEEARVGSGSPKIETRSQDNNEATTKVVFADAVKPSKEDLAVEKKIPVKTHYDDFRGLYYIDAKELKSSSASPSSRGLFSGKLSENELNKTSEVVVIPKGVM